MTRNLEDGQSRHELIAELGRLHLRSERDGDVHYIALRGELDLANAEDVQRELKRVESTDAKAIVVDLQQLSFLDSTGIRLLLEAQARSMQDGQRLSLLRAPEIVQRVLRIAGVEDRLPFAD